MEEFLTKLRALQYKLLLFMQQFGKRADNTVNTLAVLLGLFCIGNVILQIGFKFSQETADWLVSANSFAIVLFGIIQIYKFFSSLISNKSTSIWQILYLLAIWLFIIYSDEKTDFLFLAHNHLIHVIAVLLSVYQISSLSISFLTRKVSPTMMFAGSFFLVILIGTGLLILPRCHYDSMSFLEALFTSTSSVCVTGLALFDISKTFTPFGQFIIMLLIQVGGLGVMTFTCFFAVSLTGKGSLQNRMVIKDIISADNMSDIFQTLKHIMYVTFIIEGISAWLLYYYFREALPGASTDNVIFISVFHAISSFCNSGISNLPDGLQNPVAAHGTMLHMIIATTIVFGGIGFPLQSAVINWVKRRFNNFFQRLLGRKAVSLFGNPDAYKRLRLISASNRLVFYSYFAILLFGIIYFMISESQATQAGQNFIHRIADSYFLAATSHAGFLYNGMMDFSVPTLIMLVLYMWIGVAPLSTGGGIKVTTFAIALLNMRNTLLGKETIDIFGRSVSQTTIRRAFSIMTLSLLAIMMSTIALKIAMPDFPTSKLFFESVSALSTAGMTLGVTEHLNTAAQIIVIADMFIGRIGVLAFLLIFVTPGDPQRYKYPSENIML